MGSLTGKLEEVEDAFGTKDKKALKSQLKKMMKLLGDLDEDDSDSEEKSKSEKPEKKEKSKKKSEDNNNNNENDDDSEQNSKNKELSSKHQEDEEKTDTAPINNEDFSILDSPNSESDDSGRNLRKGKNCKGNGQGAKAKNRKGEWDKVKISDVSDWPDLCKYLIILFKKKI